MPTNSVLENELKHLNEDMDEIKVEMKRLCTSLEQIEKQIAVISSKKLWDFVDKKILILMILFILFAGASMGEDVWIFASHFIPPVEASELVIPSL